MKISSNPDQSAEEKELSTRQRKFVEIHATGVPAGRAYEQAGYKARGASADSAAAKLLRNDKVSEYLAKLQAEASEDCRWTKKRAMDYLCDILETPIGEIDISHHLAQEWQEGTDSVGAKIKMPGKMDALKKLCDLCGWDAPRKTEVTGKDGGPIKQESEFKVTPEDEAAIVRIREARERLMSS